MYKQIRLALPHFNLLYINHLFAASISQNKLTGLENQKLAPNHLRPRKPANEWSIEEVIEYITETDPALAIHADLLRKHVTNLTYFDS